MKTEKLVPLLAETVRRFGYKVRTEEGNFRGGQCLFADEKLVILNRRMGMDERAELLAMVLENEDIESVFILPELRSFLERRARKARADATDDRAEHANAADS